MSSVSRCSRAQLPSTYNMAVARGVATALHTLQLEGAPQARGPQEQQGKTIIYCKLLCHCKFVEITAGTLVPSSVNGDIAIQWEWSKFDPLQNPDPLTDYDKTLHN